MSLTDAEGIAAKNAVQERLGKRHRDRRPKRGLVRFEVRGCAQDRELIRSLARKLGKDDAESARLHAELQRAVAGKPPSGKAGFGPGFVVCRWLEPNSTFRA